MKINKFNNSLKSNKSNKTLLGVCLVLFIIFIIFIVYNNNLKIYDFFTNQEIESVKWPFINLCDENNKNLPIIGIMAYIDNDKSRKKFKELIDKNIKFIGLSSNNSHPRFCDNPHGPCNKQKNITYNNKNIEQYVNGWCHCFREPNKYIKNNLPLALISESDFTNYNHIIPKQIKKKYDFIAIQPKDNNDCKDGWYSYYKNWPLCKKITKILVDELGLKGIIVGRKGCEKDINIKNIKNLKLTDNISHDTLKKYMNESRFTLLPNLEEASPRVLVESLCLDTPVLVYENILGGWKYVNNNTGEFFNENDIKDKVRKILSKKYSPRQYFIDNYGIEKSGYRLKKFLQSIYPNMNEINETKYIQFSKGW